MWWVVQSNDGFRSMQWGLPGDYPTQEDYDGDGKDDFAVWRPSLGMWAVILSSKSFSKNSDDIIWKQWGLPEDHPMPGDYDGDSKADLVGWRDSDGNWYVCGSRSGFACQTSSTVQQFGLPGDTPVKGDFDGDAVLDFAVWRSSTGQWFWKRSSDGAVQSRQWGLPGDSPIGAGVKSMLK